MFSYEYEYLLYMLMRNEEDLRTELDNIEPKWEEKPQEKAISHREQERRLPKWAKTCKRMK